MAATFDPYDKKSWYFGPLSRLGAEDLLSREEVGVFLVRNSTTSAGDLVLCVKEGERVSHYIVHKIQQGDQTRFRIGDQVFPDIPALLHYYKNTFLDTTSLKRPIDRPEQVRANYDFDGRDEDDLPFRKGEILTILSKGEDQWWTARNENGQFGSIPVPYVEPYTPGDESPNGDVQQRLPNASGSCDELLITDADQEKVSCQTEQIEATNGNGIGREESKLSSPPPPPPLIPADPRRRIANRNTLPVLSSNPHPDHASRLSQPGDSSNHRAPQITLPAKARVIQAKVPNAYDKTALRLQVGDIITVTRTNITGQWEGELNGRTGHFPFTHVQILDPDPDEETSVTP